jgi:hypothetical protein
MGSDPDNDPEPASPGAIDLPCAPPDTPIRERLGETVPEEAQVCVLQGRPYLWFKDWDYAEDWSGEFARAVHPDSLSGALQISITEFWALVRQVHGLLD